MKLLDRIAINSLIKTITSFILAIVKIFVPDSQKSVSPKKRRPIRDAIDRILNNDK